MPRVTACIGTSTPRSTSPACLHQAQISYILPISTGQGLHDVQRKNASRYCSKQTVRNPLLCCCGMRAIIGVPLACRTSAQHKGVDGQDFSQQQQHACKLPHTDNAILTCGLTGQQYQTLSGKAVIELHTCILTRSSNATKLLT